MKFRLLGLVLALLFVAPVTGQAQATMGYDTYGRLTCVYYPNATPKITRYSYDETGNRTQRTVAAASGQTCTSQAVGPPPSLPVTLTATNPSAELNSQAAATYPIATLGTTTDSGVLTLVSAATSGGAGSCGSATVTTTQFIYTAPLLNPAGAQLTCYVDYVFAHSNGQQKSGRLTVTVLGVTPPGGGEGGDGENPPPVCNPKTGVCTIG
jgi:YD repeat-containing protein